MICEGACSKIISDTFAAMWRTVGGTARVNVDMILSVKNWEDISKIIIDHGDHQGRKLTDVLKNDGEFWTTKGDCALAVYVHS